MKEFDTVLDTPDLVVRHQPGVGPTRDFWVTFNGLKGREPMGSGFIRRDSGAALHVISLRDDWFQVFDVEAVTALIERHRPRGARVVLFGSSMGAFGALAFAKAFRADLVLIAGPQVIVDIDATAPHDTRWATEWRAIKDAGVLIRPDARTGLTPRTPVIAFYDSWTRQDRWQMDHLSGLPNVHAIDLPTAGHAVFYHLQEIGLWPAFMQAALLEDHAALEGLKRVFWRARKKNYFYLCELGLIAQQRGHLKAAELVFRTAAARWPDIHKAWVYLKDARLHLGDYEGAVEAARAAAAQVRGRADLWALHQDVVSILAVRHDWDAVDAAYRLGIEDLPRSADLLANYAGFRQALSRAPEGTVELLERAVALAPDRRDLQAQLEQARARYTPPPAPEPAVAPARAEVAEMLAPSPPPRSVKARVEGALARLVARAD